MMKALSVSIGEYSTKGRKPLNQDFHDIRIPPEPLLSTKGIAIAIADGISSSPVSQEASKTSVSYFLEDYFSTSEAWSVKKSAQRVLYATNSWIYAQNRQNQYHWNKDRGYVCTFSAMVIKSNTAYLFHVGDARIYRIRQNTLEQLTEDHRVWVSKEESYLSRAFGIDAQIRIDYDALEIEEGDLFLFMTDGVYEYLSQEYLLEIEKHHANTLPEMAKEIVEYAYKQGSDDNLTLQIVRVDTLPNKSLLDIDETGSQKPFPPLLEERQSLDGYTIVRKLSSTFRSHVYLARDEDDNSLVVLKTPSTEFKNDPKYIERFLLEEWIARKINNPHVLKATPQTRKRNYLYNVTQYIEGKTLTQWMRDHPSPSLEQVRVIAEQIAKALLAFHRQEMVHQDLRPDNILIDETNTITVIDFGSTKVQGIEEINSEPTNSDILGTLQYSAPEYFLGEEGTAKSDFFSLGVIVYEMLSGKLPYGTAVPKATSKKSQKKLRYDSLYREDLDIPIWVDETVKKMLHPNPYKRYQELSEFSYDLRHPNEAFLKKRRPPLKERNPVSFWQIIAFLEAVAIFMLLLF
ncbi:MAG TPA: bifunctional protein-serine/threonine kinase/phosphatase [Campylobacterales bacterium]|nr:bifunctional protein-serine/threonine kinase/phosphatase [Campylobacterales bacterium]